MNIFAVGLGGAIGALCRYFLGQFIPKLGIGFPFGTFSVNLIGCFMIGAIVGFVGRNSGLGPRLVLFLQTGICGGFTTSQHFPFETVSLLEEGKFVVAGTLYCLERRVLEFLSLLMVKSTL